MNLIRCCWFFTDGGNYTLMSHFAFHWIHHDLSFDNYHFILFMTTVSLVLFHHPTNAMISLIIYIILSLSDDCTICIIPSINTINIFIICLILALSAMMNLSLHHLGSSFASFHHCHDTLVICIILLSPALSFIVISSLYKTWNRGSW